MTTVEFFVLQHDDGTYFRCFDGSALRFCYRRADAYHFTSAEAANRMADQHAGLDGCEIESVEATSLHRRAV